MSEHGSDQQIGRRDFLRMGGAAAAALALDPMGVSRAVGETTRSTRPNIIFVFSDEHRWCSLPFTEMPQMVTPNMARLAREGTRFDNCCSTSPICVPYRGMLITGQWPHQSSCISNDWFGSGDVIGVDSPTIAHTFKAAGYVTGYVGKWHLKNQTCKNAGFDYFKHWRYGDNHWATPVRDIPSGEDFKIVKGYNATGMTDQAIEFIGQHAADDKPMMLMLSINPPHWKWDDAPEEFVKLYPQDKMAYRPNVTQERHKQGKDLLYYQHYHAHISAVDRELGRLMDALKARGIEDNTVLIYTSDHGSSFGSNGVGSKANPYEEAVRVPFFVRWPGRIAANRVVDNNMGTIDLYPSLCGLAGIKAPAQCGGQDFSPVMLGKPGPDPASQFILVNNFVRNYFRTQLEPGEWNYFYPFRGVRTKRYTYVVYAEGDWLLYDNQKDPYQLRNLAGDPAYAGVKADLAKELKAWLAKAEDPFIPEEWRKLSIPDRIARQNRHWTLCRYKRQWSRYKSDALKPYLAGGVTADQQKQLRAAGDRVFDEPFFGPYMALHNEVHGKKRYAGKRPREEFRVRLVEHKKKAAARFKAKAEKILNTAE
jgi:arylsulfatase A-like enzyme